MSMILPFVFCLWIQDTPSYEGFGESVRGGTGGKTVYVTSLKDDGAGTLRQAITRNGPVIIRFKVQGTIKLARKLSMRGKKRITIDGRTAPGKGITLEGDQLEIRNSEDIIIRHIRVRNSRDAGIMLFRSCKRIVVDHCSVSNAGDESIGVYAGPQDVTISWCLVTNSNKAILISAQPNWPTDRVSVHHNVLTNCFQRNPQIHGPFADVRNNIIHNWGNYGIRVREGGTANVVANLMLTRRAQRSSLVVRDTAKGVYASGNKAPVNIDSQSTRKTPYKAPKVKTVDVSKLPRLLLDNVGAHPRDEYDLKVLAELAHELKVKPPKK